MDKFLLSKLANPADKSPLLIGADNTLRDPEGNTFVINDHGVPLFASSSEVLISTSLQQQAHYDIIAQAYQDNLESKQHKEYIKYLDSLLAEQLVKFAGEEVLELCCGSGELDSIPSPVSFVGVGIDLSEKMLNMAIRKNRNNKFFYVQGDATNLPILNNSFDTVVMLGGIHHVPDRNALFSEVFRVLKPGGAFIFREPLNDFWLWRLLRSGIYYISPLLNHDTERPLKYCETVPILDRCGLKIELWIPAGLFGFCLFMNSDVLFFNRFFSHIPGIEYIVRAFVRLDRFLLSLKSLRHIGLQVVGVALKPKE